MRITKQKIKAERLNPFGFFLSNRVALSKHKNSRKVILSVGHFFKGGRDEL